MQRLERERERSFHSFHPQFLSCSIIIFIFFLPPLKQTLARHSTTFLLHNLLPTPTIPKLSHLHNYQNAPTCPFFPKSPFFYVSNSSRNTLVTDPKSPKLSQEKWRSFSLLRPPTMRQEAIFLQDSRNPPEPKKPTLKQSIESLSSLILLTHSIRVFLVKWQLIRSKLEELNSGLTAAAEAPDQNPAVSGLIRAVMVTAAEGFDLARRCTDLSYSGKLLMQSDLDIVLAKLDLHVKSLNEIYFSGMLNIGNALIVSKPGVGACKDDMRFYVRDLLTRMRVGDSDMKRQALVNLLEVVREDDKYVKIVIETGEIVLLVGFLEIPDPRIQELSAKIVSVIAGFDSCKGALISSGAIAPLIRVLESGSPAAKEWSSRCLMKLTQNADNAWSVSAHGGVTALLKICSCESSTAELIGPSCGVLRNLVGVEEIKRFMVEEGAVAIFVKLVKSKDDIVQMNAMDFLQAMASGDEITRQTVIKEGGIRALLKILDPISTQSSKSREVALRVIENLFFNSSTCISTLVSFRFIELLLHYLRNGEASVQEIALKVSTRLCSTSEEAKKLLGDAGFMSEFVKFLEAKLFEVREMAAEALSTMVMVPKNRKRFIQEDRNIGSLLRLLDPEEGNPGYKKFLLSTLMEVTSCNNGRRKVLNSGYLKNIEKLAEAEVSDAKKLVRKLSTNRFKSMLSGMWHS